MLFKEFPTFMPGFSVCLPYVKWWEIIGMNHYPVLHATSWKCRTFIATSRSIVLAQRQDFGGWSWTKSAESQVWRLSTFPGGSDRRNDCTWSVWQHQWCRRCLWQTYSLASCRCKKQYIPNSTWLVTSRLETSVSSRAVSTWRTSYSARLYKFSRFYSLTYTNPICSVR